MPDELYERDALAWAEQQAALLRRLAAGEGVNEAVDWSHVIEEVQDVRLSELQACRSLLRQAMVHLLKQHAWSKNSAGAHWRGETAGFLAEARDRFTPSMRRRIDLADLYTDALYELQAGAADAGEPGPPPETSPFTLDELLAKHPDVTRLVAKLSAG